MCGELCAILEAHRRSAGFVLRPANGHQSGKRYHWEWGGLLWVVSTSAGIGLWMTPHVMRHTVASLAAQAGISLYKIGKWMGHSSSEVTEIYAHLAAYDADIDLMAPDSAVQGAPPAELRLDPSQGRRLAGAAQLVSPLDESAIRRGWSMPADTEQCAVAKCGLCAG